MDDFLSKYDLSRNGVTFSGAYTNKILSQIKEDFYSDTGRYLVFVYTPFYHTEGPTGAMGDLFIRTDRLEDIKKILIIFHKNHCEADYNTGSDEAVEIYDLEFNKQYDLERKDGSYQWKVSGE